MAEEINIDIKINNANAANSLGKLNKSLKDLKSAQEGLDKSSPDFKKLSDAINKTEGRIGELNDSFRTLTGTGTERLRNSLSLVKESITNLDFDKFKIGIKGATIAFGGLKSALGALGLGLVIQAVSYIIENFEKLKKSSGFLGVALRAIGSIIATITEGITWLLDKIGIIDSEADRLAKNNKERAEKNVKSSEMEKNAIIEKYDTEIGYAKAAGKDVSKLEDEKVKAVVESNNKQIQSIKELARVNGSYTDEQLKQIEDLNKSSRDIINKNGQQKVDDIKKRSDEAIKNMIDDFNKEKELRKKNAEEARKIELDNVKKNYDELKKQGELNLINVEKNTTDYLSIKAEQYKKEEQFIEENKKKLSLSELDIKLIKAKNAQELIQINKSIYDKKREEEEKEYNRIKAIEENNKKISEDALLDFQNRETMRLENEIEFNNLSLDETIKNLNEIRDIELSKKNLSDEEKLRITEKYLQKEKELIDQNNNAKFEIASNLNNSLISLNDAFFEIQKANGDKSVKEQEKNAKIQFDINKALSISSTIITGIQGVMNALSAKSVLPEPAATAFRASNAIAIGAASVANVAKIAATKYKSTNTTSATTPSSSSPTPSSSSPTTSNFNAASFYGIGQSKLDPNKTKDMRPIVSVEEINRVQKNVDVYETRSKETL